VSPHSASLPPGSVGFVKARSLVLRKVELDCGAVLPSVTVSYETYGRLDERKSNAILVLHAFSGGAHAAGWMAGQDPAKDKPGWWDYLIGPGKAVDTDRFFVISSNVLGSCYGTTGPSDPNPETGEPWGLSFPPVTIRDMVRVQNRLVDHLGIERLLAVLGGSMGGMQALQWAVDYPERVAAAIPIACTWKHTPQQVAFNYVGRAAILMDAHFHNGDYYGKHCGVERKEAGNGKDAPHCLPKHGLKLGRMVGTITYLSPQKMTERFGGLDEGLALRSRRRSEPFPREEEGGPPTLGAVVRHEEAQVGGYLEHQGESFVGRFDANSYLCITKALDTFAVAADRKGLNAAFAGKELPRFLLISFSTDWLYPPEHSKEVVNALRWNHADVAYYNVETIHGHDAFLIEYERAPDPSRDDRGERMKMIDIVDAYLEGLARNLGIR
jgi:homoserine O-acetyltransferase